MVATPEPETVPSRKPEATTARPGRRRGRLLAEEREGPLDEELPGAAAVEHGTEQCEDDDEGRGDIQWRREQAFKGQIILPDDARDREAAMIEGLRHIGAEIAIDEKADGDERQHPAGGAARRFENDQDERAAEPDLDTERHGGAGLRRFEMRAQVDDRGDGDGDQQPVHKMDARATDVGAGR